MPRENDTTDERPGRDLGEKVGDRVSIRKRGKTWYANWQEAGRQRRRSLKTASKKEATTRAWKIEREIEERAKGLAKEVEPATVDEAIDAYDEYLLSEGRSAKTLVKYRAVFKHVRALASRRGAATVDGLDLNFWDAFRADRKRAGTAEKTRYTECAILRQLVRFAISRKLVAADPMAGDNLKLGKPRPMPQPCWTRAEAERIVAAAREPFRTAFAVLLDTGLRAEELLHLTKANIDFSANVIRVRPKNGWKPKSGDERAVPMTPRVAELLRPPVARLRPDDWLFTAAVTPKHPQAGRRLTGRRLLAALKRVTKRLGLPGHVHTFRHTFISEAVMHGVAEAVIRTWVGHVDPEILRLYTHIHDAAGQAEMRRLAAAAERDEKDVA